MSGPLPNIAGNHSSSLPPIPRDMVEASVTFVAGSPSRPSGIFGDSQRCQHGNAALGCSLLQHASGAVVFLQWSGIRHGRDRGLRLLTNHEGAHFAADPDHGFFVSKVSLLILLARISHRWAKRGRGDGGKDKARDSSGAQAYFTARRPIRRERIGVHAVRPQGAHHGWCATVQPQRRIVRIYRHLRVRSRESVRFAG